MHARMYAVIASLVTGHDHSFAVDLYNAWLRGGLEWQRAGAPWCKRVD